MKQLVAGLEQYARDNPKQQSLAVEFLAFLGKHGAQALSRTLDEGHFTASCWLLNPAKTHVLLTHHRKLNIWVQLGGHADGDVDLPAVSLREAREESGIHSIEFLSGKTIFDIDRHLIPARGSEPQHFHCDVRFALRARSELITVSDESHDLRWVELGKLHSLTSDESVLRMERKWLNGAR